MGRVNLCERVFKALSRAADEFFVFDGEHFARLDLDSLRHAHAPVGELEPRVIGASLHPGYFQPLVMVDLAVGIVRGLVRAESGCAGGRELGRLHR